MAEIVKRASDIRTKELNFSQVLISLSSSIACMPIVSKQGSPFPKHFTNNVDYTFEYGSPNPSISMSIQMGLDYFTEGTDLWGLRVTGQGAKYSAILMYQDGAVTKLIPVSAGIVDPLNVDWNALLPKANTEAIALFYPNRGPGSYGDIFGIGISTKNLTTPANISAVSHSTGGFLPASTYSYRIAALGQNGETLASAPAEVIISAAGVTNSVSITWDAIDNAIGYAVYGRADGSGCLATVGAGTTSFVDAGTITADVAHQPITDPADLAAQLETFDVQLFDTSANLTTPAETFSCTLDYAMDASGAQSELEDRINPFSQYLKVVSNAAALIEFPKVTACQLQNMAGGNSGAAPTSYEIVKAMQVFRNKQLYRVNTFINAGFSDPIVQKALDSIAQYRGDAVALLDVPSAKQKFQSAIDYRRLELNLNSTYSALFCPDILEADLTNGRQIYVPFSGMAAALLARTDRVSDPSRSPAGLNRGLIDALKQRYQYDDPQASALFEAQVNYIRTFSGAGMALWEQQTLANEFSALSWLNVRRITNVIKTASYDYLLYALQEPNSDHLKRSIVDGLTTYLQNLKNNDSLSDFNVVCDNTNNSLAVANAAILVVSIVLVPMLAVHEIQLQMIISKQGVSFKEVLRKAGNQ